MIKKRLISTIFMFILLTSFYTSVFAQDQSQDQDQPAQPYSVEPLLESIRKNYDKNDFNTIYVSLLDAVTNHPNELSWFYYAIFAESAYKTGRTASLQSKLPDNLNMMILSRSMREWANNKPEIAAGLLSQIKHLSPSLSYLIGKMYYSQGKIGEGAAYFSHASDMNEAPYGSYYYGITQLGEGYYSRSIRALKNVVKDTQDKEPNLNNKAKLQLMRAYYGDRDYNDAYELAMEMFDNNPQGVMNALDPGLILTALKKHDAAKNFWIQALKLSLNNQTKSVIRDRLEMNKYLVDDNYPPKWMR